MLPNGFAPWLLQLLVVPLLLLARPAAAGDPTPKSAAPLAQAASAGPGVSDQLSAHLTHDPKYGYLPSLLEALHISPASQLLVFSKTSGQRERISPKTPRALYFNERAYVAYLPNSPWLEISLADPTQGATFYVLEQKPAVNPQLVARQQCLECHTSAQTLHVAGYVVRSYPTDENGVVEPVDGYSMVDHRTPMAERWGGWFLDGYGTTASSAQSNVVPSSPNASSGVSPARTPTTLTGYLAPTSDLVALLVLQHQAHMQNLLTRLRQEAEQGGTGESATEKGLSAALLRYLLFVDEARLDRPIPINSAFLSGFEAEGPRDKQGRSLRQFDLHNRLFKYPCSYMIYSQSFEQLPRPVKVRLYRRLWHILTEQTEDPDFNSMTPTTKRAIIEILIETKSDLPIDWKL